MCFPLIFNSRLKNITLFYATFIIVVIYVLWALMEYFVFKYIILTALRM